MNIQKQGRKKIYIFYLQPKHAVPYERSKGMCLALRWNDHKKEEAGILKKMANVWNTNQIDSCVVRQTKVGCRQSG
jgi:hypothetical protein